MISYTRAEQLQVRQQHPLTGWEQLQDKGSCWNSQQTPRTNIGVMLSLHVMDCRRSPPPPRFEMAPHQTLRCAFCQHVCARPPLALRIQVLHWGCGGTEAQPGNVEGQRGAAYLWDCCPREGSTCTAPAPVPVPFLQLRVLTAKADKRADGILQATVFC